MNPIKLRIRKKTLVPTKNAIIHKYRSDWISVGVIDYNDSFSLFTRIGKGPIDTEAQFARYLKDNYGIGIYSVIAWRKGREGFWAFLKIEIEGQFFSRIPKHKTQAQKDKEKSIVDYKKLKKDLGESALDSEKIEINEELESLQEDMELDAEIAELEKTKSGPSPYLKASIPVFRTHSYEEYGNSQGNTILNSKKEYKLW